MKNSGARGFSGRAGRKLLKCRVRLPHFLLRYFFSKLSRAAPTAASLAGPAGQSLAPLSSSRFLNARRPQYSRQFFTFASGSAEACGHDRALV